MWRANVDRNRPEYFVFWFTQCHQICRSKRPYVWPPSLLHCPAIVKRFLGEFTGVSGLKMQVSRISIGGTVWALRTCDRFVPLTFSNEVRLRLLGVPGACHFNGTQDAASQKRKTCLQEHVFLLPHFCFDHYCFDYLPALAAVFVAALGLLTSTAGVLRLLRRLIVLLAT